MGFSNRAGSVRGAGGTVENREAGVVRRLPRKTISRIEKEGLHLMSIHEHLPPQARKGLREVGWAKGRRVWN